MLQVCPGLLCEHVNCEEMPLFRLNIKGIVHPMIRNTDLGDPVVSGCQINYVLVQMNYIFFNYMHKSVSQYSGTQSQLTVSLSRWFLGEGKKKKIRLGCFQFFFFFISSILLCQHANWLPPLVNIACLHQWENVLLYKEGSVLVIKLSISDMTQSYWKVTAESMKKGVG